MAAQRTIPRPRDRDPRSILRTIRPVQAGVERLATGFRWCEGPVWFGDGALSPVERHPQQPHHAMGGGDGAVGVFRKPSNFANGNTRDRQGRLVTCEHGGRRVTRTEYDGAITVLMRPVRGQAAQLAERRGGEVRRLDLVHRSAVRHPRQLRGNTRGSRSCRSNVYRFDARDGRGHGGRGRPQGAERTLLLARREALYVVESRATPNRLDPCATTFVDGGSVENRRVVHRCRARHAGRHAMRH